MAVEAEHPEPENDVDLDDEEMSDDDARNGKDGEEESKDMAEDGEKNGTISDDKNADEEMKDDDNLEEPKEETPKEPEAPKELEEDAPEDKRAKVAAGSVGINMADTTINVMPTCEGRMLMSLSDGGFQYLVAGARGNTGVKAGRYMFEAKIIEKRIPTDGSRGGRDAGREPWPKQLVRLGFSTSGSSLFLNDGTDGFAFDSEGHFIHGKESKRVSESKKRSESAAFDMGEAVAVVLNLDEKSPNAYTVSLFKEGVRVCQPQPIPEHLKGKTLFPTINYRNMTVHMNFGAQPFVPLPFACRMLQDAAKVDVDVANVAKPKDGKYEVLFPVALPDEGSFDWLDHFLQEHPDYTEISDRSIMAWAAKSDVYPQTYKRGGYSGSTINSNDRPEMNFGLASMDDMSVKKVLAAVTPLIQRHFVVMEVRGNLLAADRKESLARFQHSGHKRVAHVVIGEPEAKFKAHLHSIFLTEKKEKVAEETKKATAEEARKRADEREQRLKDREKRKQERERKLEEKRKAKEAEVAKADVNKEGEEEEKKVVELEEEDVMEEDEPIEELAEISVEDAVAEAVKKCELSVEEKQQFSRKLPLPDIAPKTLATDFAQFSLPEKVEGFDDVRFAWQPKAKCEEHLKSWLLEKKMMTRVEDLVPSPWFKEKWNEWYKLDQSLRKLQQDWKDPMRRRMDQAKKEDAKKEKLEGIEKKRRDKEWRKEERERKIAEREKRIEDRKRKKEQALKAKEENKKMEKIEAQEKELEKADEEKKDVEEKKDDADETKVEIQEEDKEKADEEEEEVEEEIPPEEEDEDEEMEEEEEEQKEINLEDLDVFNVDDVSDIGTGEPLCSNFSHEDWTLANLRFELHVLVHAFAKDINDPERPSFHESLLGYYYNKYFKKQFDEKDYGVSSVAEFLAIVRDTVELQKNGILEPMLSDDTPLDNFLRLTEDYRRERQQLIDSGDESAMLKFRDNHSGWNRSHNNSGDRNQNHSGGGYQGNHNSRDSGGAQGGGRSNYNDSRGGGQAQRSGGAGGYGGGGGYGSGSKHGSAPPAQSRSYGGGGSGGYGGGGGGSGSHGGGDSSKRSYDRGPGGGSGGGSGYGAPAGKGARTSYSSAGGSGGGNSKSSYGSSGGYSGGGGGYGRR